MATDHARNGDGLITLQPGEFYESGPQRLPSFAFMSSAHRSASMDNIARQVAALTRQVNEQTEQINSLTRQQGATFNSLAEFCGRAFLARLRWLVTGR